MNAAQGITQRIIGIDPGLRVSGYAILEWTDPHLAEALPSTAQKPATIRPSFAQTKSKIRIIEAGVIRIASGQRMETRLLELKQTLDEILQERQPNLMALEQLYAHYERTQPAILMGHARGVIMMAAAQHNIPVVSYAATTVKKTISGHGRAPKTQMQAAICHHLGLKVTPEPHDVADALAIALCHLFNRQFGSIAT